MAASFSLPEGYWTTASRDEFNTPCVALHHKDAGWLSDHDCEAEAIYAAQDREVEVDEAAEAAEAESYAAESKMLDSIYREVARKYDADLATDHPRNNAVKLALRALDSISVPVSEDRRAA